MRQLVTLQLPSRNKGQEVLILSAHSPFFFFFQPKTPARGLVLPTVNVAHSTPINLIQIMLAKHPQGLSS